MPRRLFASLLVLGLAVAGPLAQGPAVQVEIDQDINAKIRAEGMDNSQIMRTMHFLTDVYGPRLTGSPNHENAARWAVSQMEAWGFTNGGLEPFDFGRVAEPQGQRPHPVAGPRQPRVRSARVDALDEGHRGR
jgi:hypothetical protein